MLKDDIPSKKSPSPEPESETNVISSAVDMVPIFTLRLLDYSCTDNRCPRPLLKRLLAPSSQCVPLSLIEAHCTLLPSDQLKAGGFDLLRSTKQNTIAGEWGSPQSMAEDRT